MTITAKRHNVIFPPKKENYGVFSNTVHGMVMVSRSYGSYSSDRPRICYSLSLGRDAAAVKLEQPHRHDDAFEATTALLKARMLNDRFTLGSYCHSKLLSSKESATERQESRSLIGSSLYLVFTYFYITTTYHALLP